MCWWRPCASGWDSRPVCTRFYRFSASRFSRKRRFYGLFRPSKKIPISPKTPTNSFSSTFNRTAVMIYIDPPYGIEYRSNFQPFVNKRDAKDGKDEDLTQEPEMIRAFRDTWDLGIRSE